MRYLGVFGFISLLWFLIRVIPKPSRASYPCMRVAFPLASGFIVWMLGFFSSVLLLQWTRRLWRRSRFFLSIACCLTAAIASWFSVTGGLSNLSIPGISSVLKAEVPPDPVNDPIGTAKGVNPGRVVWVHDPDATDWEGPVPGSGEWCWEPEHTNQAIVDDMMSKTLRWLAGSRTDTEAWETLFQHINLQKGNGSRGYLTGEKVAIKINLVLGITRSGNSSSRDLDKLHENAAQTNPQLILALLRQLVYVAGVNQTDISIGDPLTFFPQEWFDYLSVEFPDIIYLDLYPFDGRTPVQFSSSPIYWSTAEANNLLPDYLPQSFAEASYLINFAVLKSHHRAGVTLCAKNHYGSLVRSPTGRLYEDYDNYYDMHSNLPDQFSGRNQYRNLVDLMGHEQLGGKTLIYLIDALYSGQGWDGYPIKWNLAPFNDDWPSSIFASQDPVAIDSVGFDFLLAEWPDKVLIGDGGAQDYLHEASSAGNPASGTVYDPERDGTAMQSLGVHEHWNNAVDKQYTRNLGTGSGIELVSSNPLFCLCDFDHDDDIDGSDIADYISRTTGLTLYTLAANFGRIDCLSQ